VTTKVTFTGLKAILLPRRRTTGSSDMAATSARALFHLPDAAVTERRRSLVEFLGQVPLFEDLARRDLGHLARIVHERDYGDGEYICEEGKPGVALFVLRRGVVEVVRRGTGVRDVSLVLLEPPASFEESAALGTDMIRRFSVRARGPVSVLALGKSDLDALSVNFPALANKVLMRLAGILAIRLELLLDVQDLGPTPEHHGSDS
jgi:CRP-like cAMP-binding protein